MPDDVLEQFVADHGTKHGFQQQYGELDLHALGWRLAELPAQTCWGPRCIPNSRTGRIPSRTGYAPLRGKDGTVFCCRPALPRIGNGILPGSGRRWLCAGIWSDRTGKSISSRAIRAMEALRGLAETGAVGEDSLHAVWIGEPALVPAAAGPWRDVQQAGGVQAGGVRPSFKLT